LLDNSSQKKTYISKLDDCRIPIHKKQEGKGNNLLALQQTPFVKVNAKIKI